eukprot:m.240111 g.240111  ORF g.240111 m.240111 type:complete len:456 (-) comp19409_c0_seq1:461-1828(-)
MGSNTRFRAHFKAYSALFARFTKDTIQSKVQINAVIDEIAMLLVPTDKSLPTIVVPPYPQNGIEVGRTPEFKVLGSRPHSSISKRHIRLTSNEVTTAAPPSLSVTQLGKHPSGIAAIEGECTLAGGTTCTFSPLYLGKSATLQCGQFFSLVYKEPYAHLYTVQKSERNESEPTIKRRRTERDEQGANATISASSTKMSVSQTNTISDDGKSAAVLATEQKSSFASVPLDKHPGSFFSRQTTKIPATILMMGNGRPPVSLPDGWTCESNSILVWQTAAARTSVAGGSLTEVGIAGFDFDNCLCNTSMDQSASGWALKYANVYSKLHDLHQQRYKIVIFTNESLERFKNADPIRKNISKKCGRLEAFCNGSPHGTPIHVLVAVRGTSKQSHHCRKPSRGMWDYFLGACKENFSGDLSATSFYVGDAAGRPSDFSDSDKKFAENIGVKFYTDDKYFSD